MKKAIVTVGCSGSGKSTWFEKTYGNSNNWVQVERDVVRKETNQVIQCTQVKTVRLCVIQKR